MLAYPEWPVTCTAPLLLVLLLLLLFCLQLIDPSSQQVLDSLPLQEAPDAVVTSVRFRLPTAAGGAANRSMLLVAKVRRWCMRRCYHNRRGGCEEGCVLRQLRLLQHKQDWRCCAATTAVLKMIAGW
jgi:hypothetical protein